MNEPRGIRNNNPLNIRLSSDKWQGQINGKGNIDGNSSLSSERAGGEAVFCVFSSMEYGWRAAFVILCKTYYGKIGPDRDLGDPQTHPTNWLLIGYAMAVMENGKTLPPIPMIKGFSLATGK